MKQTHLDDASGEAAVTVRAPKVSDLTAQLRRAGATCNAPLAEDVRACRWAGQSLDGRKWQQNRTDGTEVLPWDGASDARTFTADTAIGENAALVWVAFFRAALGLQGVDASDADSSATARTFLDWLVRQKLHLEFSREVEYAAEWMRGLGWCAVEVGWDRAVKRAGKRVTLQDLAAYEGAKAGAAGGAGDLPLPGPLPLGEGEADAALGGGGAPVSLVMAVQDPTLEDVAVELLTGVAAEFLTATLPPEVSAEDLPPLTRRQALKAIRELREAGETEVPLPYLAKNQPRIRALKPVRDVVVPSESEDGLPVTFVRALMTEPELESMALPCNGGWDADWIEAAKKTRGQYSVWNTSTTPGANLVSGMWTDGWGVVDTQRWLIEVWTAYHQALDEDGTVRLFYTVFSPHVSGEDDLAAKRGAVDYPGDAHPVVFLRRERVDRAVATSRGDAELLVSWQNVDKCALDSTIDLTSREVMPPMVVPRQLAGKRLNLSPNAEIISAGRDLKPEALALPASGAMLASGLIEHVDLRISRMLGLFHEKVPPALTALLQERNVRRWLDGWTEVLRLCWVLSLRHGRSTVARVTGIPAEALPQAEGADFDFVLSLDVAGLQPEQLTWKLKALGEIADQDQSGTLDKAKLTAMKARMVDPALGRELVVDRGAAADAMSQEVGNNVAAMFLGNPARLQDASNDPAGSFKHEALKGTLAQNPRYLMALTDEAIQGLMAAGLLDPMTAQQVAQAQPRNPDPLFSGNVVKYGENLQQAKAQQENKGRGRTGV